MSYLNDDSLSYLISKIKDNFVSEAELTSALVNYLAADGSDFIVNPVIDLDDFGTGIALFQNSNSNIANCPMPNTDAIWLIISAGNSNTQIQIAYPLRHYSNPGADPLAPFSRYKTNAVWESWIHAGVGAINCSSNVTGYEGIYNLRIAQSGQSGDSGENGWITFVLE